MFDSWTKFPSGVLSGNTMDLGNFDQCVSLKHDTKSTAYGEIRGQHCIVYYGATDNDKSNFASDTTSIDIFSGKK